MKKNSIVQWLLATIFSRLKYCQMKRVIFFLPLMLFFTKNSVAQDKPTKEQLQALIDYRDNQLVKNYDAIFFQIESKEDALNDLKNMEQKLTDDATWQTSDATLLIGQLATGLKAVCDLTGTILTYVSPHAEIELIYTAGIITAKGLDASLADGWTVDAFNKEMIIDIGKEIAASSDKYVARPALAVYELKEAIEQLTDSLPENRDKLRESISEQLEHLNSGIEGYQSSLEDFESNLDEINSIQKRIDDYVADNQDVLNDNSNDDNGVQVDPTTDNSGSSQSDDNSQSTQSDNSSQSTQPDNSSQSSQPDNSSQSSQPDNSSQSTQPDNSSQSSQPDNSSQSTQPDNSSQSTQPDNSSQSSQPDNSSQSSQPDNSSQSSQPDSDDTPHGSNIKLSSIKPLGFNIYNKIIFLQSSDSIGED
jgi:hypothetical protein